MPGIVARYARMASTSRGDIVAQRALDLADANPRRVSLALRELANAGSEAISAAPSIRALLSDPRVDRWVDLRGGSVPELEHTSFDYLRVAAVIALARIDPLPSGHMVAPVVVEALSLVACIDEPFGEAAYETLFVWRPEDLIPFGAPVIAALEAAAHDEHSVVGDRASKLLAQLRDTSLRRS